MDIKNEVLKHFEFKKSYGQNYLFDEEILNGIADAGAACGAAVAVEIGAGAGTLTRKIAERFGRVIALEIDGDILPFLEKNVSEFDNVKILRRNPLTFEPKAFDELCGDDCAVVSNLPYNITTGVVELLALSNVRSFTLLLQKEAAARITAPNGGDFGYTSALIQSVGSLRTEFDVPRTCFTPPPEVDGRVITFTRTHRVTDAKAFTRFFKSCFLNKRKTLSNNFKSSYNLSREEVESVLTSLGFEANARSLALGADGLKAVGCKLGYLNGTIESV